MFMLPGGGAMHMNDSLGKSKSIKYICCLHEQACAIAAEAYARVNNKLGMLMVTTGPGSTNAITGVAAAWIESTPMLILSGQVKMLDQIRNQGIRQQGMQEVDIISIVTPITKYAVMVTEPETIKYHLDKALYEAMNGRKGPVWLDIPLDIQASMIDEDILVGFEAEKVKKPDLEEKVIEIIRELNNSERPILMAGNGIRLGNAVNEFRQLIEILNIPILTSWNGIDLIEDNNPLFYGRPGGLGHRYANFIQQNSDLFISLGARLNLLQTGYNFDGFARAAKKIMVDIDEAELRKINVRPDLAIAADVKEIIGLLLKHKSEIAYKPRKAWFEYSKNMKAKYPIVLKKHWEEGECVNTYALLDTISEQMQENDIFVAGSSGSCIEVSMQVVRVKKGQRVFTTKGLASMGFGLPASIGACLASGGKRVICVNGDGGFQMNIQELQTLKRLNLPIKIFVLNNSGYAAIYGTQTNLFNGNLVACNEESDLSLPNLLDVANAYKLRTERILKNSELEDKVANVLAIEGPVICEVLVPIDLKVLPKQISYKRTDGQMESMPLEYMNPPLAEKEFSENMIIPIWKMN